MNLNLGFETVISFRFNKIVKRYDMRYYPGIVWALSTVQDRAGVGLS